MLHVFFADIDKISMFGIDIKTSTPKYRCFKHLPNFNLHSFVELNCVLIIYDLMIQS